ncbi:hypothetical protein BGW39_011791 [Mortierella sp. 14UC]|nr:hypothetical protein BGW39_011791 [Mortierella sp. 14UC]
MDLFRNLSSMPCKTPVIFLSTLSDPNPLDTHGNNNNHSNHNDNCGGSGSGSSNRTPQHLQRHYQHYQHYQQHEESSTSFFTGPSSSEPMMMYQQDEEDAVDPAATHQEGKKKKKKKKKKASSSSALSFDTAPGYAESAASPPPKTLPSINEKDNENDIMNKEFPTLLESFGVAQGQSDAATTKSKNKKSKAKKKAAAAAAAAAATAAEAEVETGPPIEQAGSRTSQVHFKDERRDMTMMAEEQGPISVSGNMDYHGTFGDLGHRQVLYSSVASGKDSLDFLNDDFMNTGLSNWADDIDEYEQRQDPPIYISTAFPTASATTVATSPQQTAWEDTATPKTLVYKGPVVTQVASDQSQDASYSTAPDPRKSYSYWEPTPRPFEVRPGKMFRGYPERSYEYEQPQPSREYSERLSEYHQRHFGEFPTRPSDYHQQPPARYQPGYSHRPPMHKSPTHAHRRQMAGGRPPYQHQILYLAQPRPQAQQPHFERAVRPTHPLLTDQHLQQLAQQPTKQTSQQHTKQPSQLPPQQPSTQPTKQLSQQPTKQPPKRPQQQSAEQSSRKHTEQHHHHKPLVVSSDHALDPTPAQAFSKQPKTDGTSHSPTKIDADNPWISSTKPGWMARLGSRGVQGPAGSKVKPEVEGKNNSTAGPATNTAGTGTVRSLQVSRTPKDKRATTESGLDKTISQSQKHRQKKQQERRQQSLPAHSQAQSYDQPQWPPLTQGQQQSKAESHGQLFSHAEKEEMFYDEEEPQWAIKAVELPWTLNVNGKSNRSGNEPWGDRNKVIEFFSNRWVEARMSSGGRDPDAAVVYCSSP